MNTPAYAPTKLKALIPLRDTILICDMKFDERISRGGIIIMNDDMKSSGIRPRWGRVYAVGPDQVDVKVGQWICVEHGRWTRGAKIDDGSGKLTIHKVDNNAIMLVSDEPVEDSTMSDKV